MITCQFHVGDVGVTLADVRHAVHVDLGDIGIDQAALVLETVVHSVNRCMQPVKVTEQQVTELLIDVQHSMELLGEHFGGKEFEESVAHAARVVQEQKRLRTFFQQNWGGRFVPPDQVNERMRSVEGSVYHNRRHHEHNHPTRVHHRYPPVDGCQDSHISTRNAL